jgi:hypothetical protein
MAQRQPNQAEKLHANLRVDEYEFRRHLGNTGRDFQRHLACKGQKGFNIDGSYDGS